MPHNARFLYQQPKIEINNYLIVNWFSLPLQFVKKYLVLCFETKCFTPRNESFQAVKLFLKLIATGEEVVKLLPFTRKLLIHRRDREKVKENIERLKINIR